MKSSVKQVRRHLAKLAEIQWNRLQLNLMHLMQAWPAVQERRPRRLSYTTLLHLLVKNSQVQHSAIDLAWALMLIYASVLATGSVVTTHGDSM